MGHEDCGLILTLIICGFVLTLLVIAAFLLRWVVPRSEMEQRLKSAGEEYHRCSADRDGWRNMAIQLLQLSDNVSETNEQLVKKVPE